MWYMRYSLALVCFFAVPLCADMIWVNNETELPVFVASYLKPKNIQQDAQRTAGPQEIGPRSSIQLERLELGPFDKRWWNSDRMLYFSRNSDGLKQKISHSESLLLGSTPITTIRGTTYYVYGDRELEGASDAEWKIVLPVVQQARQAGEFVLRPLLDKARERLQQENPYRNEVGKVILGTDVLPQEEIDALKNRLPRAQQALSRVLGQEITQEAVPHIALVLSGGGMRAQCCAAGFTRALEELGLLDAVMYVTSLSGSTWFVAPWTISGLTVKDFIAKFKPQAARRFEADFDVELVTNALLRDLVYGEPASIVDVYGTMLAKRFLSPFTAKPLQTVTLNDQKQQVLNGTFPVPLYTSIVTNITPHKWMEYSPFWIALPALNSWVQPQFYGRTFVAGKSTNDAAPYDLGHLMAVFGSAINVSVREAFGILGKNLLKPLYDIALKTLQEFDKGGLRVLPEYVHNYMYHMPESSFANQKFLVTVDAGIENGIPIAPLMHHERWPDLIIIMDASDPVVTFLKITEQFVRSNGFPLPPINYEGLDAKPFTLFTDPKNDPLTPSVIYVPCVANDEYSKTYKPLEEMKLGRVANTFNFVYTPEQYDELSGLMTFAVKQHKDELIAELKRIVERKQRAIS